MLHTEYLSISSIHRAYADRALSVRELVMVYLHRIADTDQSENGCNAVLEVNPDALFIADALDARLEGGEIPSALFGIPVLLKDNINTSDKMATSAGSVALSDNLATYDASIAARLRKAGAVILGKSNMTEFANYMSRDNMPTGYSSRGNRTLSPFNKDCNPGGSSTGSAVALITDLCALAVGTETSGSVIYPAIRNGIVGLKPTMGLISRHGIIPISRTLDTAGPMARSVYDVAALLGAMAGHDEQDPATHALKCNFACDYTKDLHTSTLKGVRIGINNAYDREADKPNAEDHAAFDNLCRVLTDAGAILVQGIDVKGSAEIGKIMKYEFKRCMNAYLSSLHGSTAMQSLADIVAYNQAHAEKALRYGQSILLDCQNGTSGALTEPDYLNALAARKSAIQQLDQLFDDNHIDVMLCSSPFSNFAAFTGFPSMTLPAGRLKNGMPLGSHWIGRRFDESRLLKIAHAAEQNLGLTIRPQ